MTRTQRALDSLIVTRIVQGIAVIALMLSLWLAVQIRDQTACQARYNEASNASQRGRAEAAATDRAALDKLLGQVADDPEHAVGSIRAYTASRADADRQRAANPVPPPPSETCG